MEDSRPQASSAALVRKVLQILDVLRGSPPGAVIYRQIEQVLADLENVHLRTERTYAALLYALLDAYLQHLPIVSPVYVQVKVLQQRLQPPLSLLDTDGLRSQVDLYADQIANMQSFDVHRLGRVLAPLLTEDMGSHEGCAAPAAEREGGAGHDAAERQLHDSLAGSELGTDAADDRRTMIRQLQESLSREIRQTISQNEEFGVMLDLVMGELQHEQTMEGVEEVRQHLTDQVKRLHQAHYALAEKLDSADRYLRIIEMDSAKLSAELSHARQMSLTDELTGLPNRRAFLNRLEDEVGRVQRYGMPLSLAVVDLDRFKGINDRYGHAAGDAVLQCYASRIFSIFRHHDLVARYGGEEFAVLLPNTDSAGALRALQKIKERAASQVCKTEHLSVQLPTFSAGLAVYRPGEPPHSFIERADSALYQAKRLGRNRVEVDAQGSQPVGRTTEAADPEPSVGSAESDASQDCNDSSEEDGNPSSSTFLQ